MKSNYTKFVEIILTACNKWKNTIKQYLLYPGKNSVWPYIYNELDFMIKDNERQILTLKNNREEHT